MKPAKSRVSKLSMRGAASRLSVARSFMERRKSKADDDQETLGGFNPSVISKQKPALLAQSNMLQTMLISRSSMALRIVDLLVTIRQ